MRSLSIIAAVMASTLAAGCAASTDDGETLGQTSSAITPIPIPGAYLDSSYYSITPIPIPGARPIYADFTLDGAAIVYLSQRSSITGPFYTAVKIGLDGAILAESQSIAGTANDITNLVVANGAAVFGDGKRTVTLPLNPFVKPTTSFASPDPTAPEVHGNGLAPLGDGSVVNVFTFKGFAWNKLYSAPRCGSSDAYECTWAAGDLTPGHRGFWQVGEKSLKNVAIGESSASVTSNCSLGTFSTSTFAPDSPVSSAKDEDSGRIHVAAKLGDGRLVECRGALGSSGYRILDLPFKGIVDFSFDGGGGTVIDPSPAHGNLWVAASSIPSLAYLPTGASTAAKVDLTTAAAGTAQWSASVPRAIKTIGQSAFVLTADRRILRVDHR